MTDETRLRALVSGDVQGVGFRDWTRRQAAHLGLAGSASNLPDGRVEVIAEGPRAAVQELLAALQGTAPGSVSGVDDSWADVQGEAGFRLG
ncbi:MAG: acylphosphatase [Jatrophihabitans sp.]